MSLMISGQEKMAKHLLFTPSQVAPLCHLQTLSHTLLYTTYHFLRLSCVVPVVPTRAGTLSKSLLHRAWHIVGPQ